MALTVKRAPANAHQQEMGKLIVQITRGRGGDQESCAGAVATAIQESGLSNISHGDRDSVGLYQQRPSQGWGTVAQIRDPNYAINKFLDKFLSFRQRGMGWLQASHQTQKSGHPNAPAQWYSEGMAFANGVTGSADAGGSGAGGFRIKPYEFSRGSADKPETSWDCMGRLAEEVKWRRFMSRGELWYASENWMFEKQDWHYRFTEEAPGILKLSFKFETRSDASEMNVTVIAGRYAIVPGMIIRVAEQGPADGDWIVKTVRRSWQEPTAEIQLARKQPKLPEPAPETENIAVGDSGQAGSTGGRSGSVYEASEKASAKNWSYSQPRRNQQEQGYADCSSGVTWVLREAGIETPPSSGGNAPVSGMYLNWGQPGTGQDYTVWTNNGHIWIQHHGKAHWRFDTGGGSGGKNWGTPRSTGGFTPRHK